MDKPKICPIMAQGWLSNPHIAKCGEFIVSDETHTWSPDRLPKCLKGECALWISYNGQEDSGAGWCGLVK